jgi:hypothetical protein
MPMPSMNGAFRSTSPSRVGNFHFLVCHGWLGNAIPQVARVIWMLESPFSGIARVVYWLSHPPT